MVQLTRTPGTQVQDMVRADVLSALFHPLGGGFILVDDALREKLMLRYDE